MTENRPDAPSFPFYAREWLNDCVQLDLSAAARGAYICLLAAQWELFGKPLPNDLRRMAKLAGLEYADLKKVWPQLEEHFPPVGREPNEEGGRLNRRLERERAGQRERSERRRGAAKRRWDKPAASNADARQMQSMSNADATSTSTSRKTKTTTLIDSLDTYAVRCVKAANRVMDRIHAGGYRPLRWQNEKATTDGWKAAGIPVELAERVIADNLEKAREQKVSTLKYFDAPLQEAHLRKDGADDEPTDYLVDDGHGNMVRESALRARRVGAATNSSLVDQVIGGLRVAEG